MRKEGAGLPSAAGEEANRSGKARREPSHRRGLPRPAEPRGPGGGSSRAPTQLATAPQQRAQIY